MSWRYILLAFLALVCFSQACDVPQVTRCQQIFAPHKYKILPDHLDADGLKKTCESVKPTLTCLDGFRKPCASHLTFTSTLASVEAFKYVCKTEDRKSDYLESLECLKNKFKTDSTKLGECMQPIERIRPPGQGNKPTEPEKKCEKFKTAFQCYYYVLEAKCGADVAEVKKKYEIRAREYITKPLNCTVEISKNMGAASGVVSLLLMAISMFLAVLVL